MFNKTTKKTSDADAAPVPRPAAADAAASVPGASATTISGGSTLCGELDVESDLQVDGTVKGRLRVGNRFVIGRDGKVTSEGIECSVAEISGVLEGPVTATQMLTIHAGGHIKGDIAVREIVIEKGGRLDGRCQYLPSEAVKAPKPAAKTPAAEPEAAAAQP